MKKFILFIGVILFSSSIYANSLENETFLQQKNIAIVKGMFTEFAEKLNVNKLDQYYSKDFILESNGKRYSYQEYKTLQQNIYQTLTSLKVVKYDDIFATSNKVVSRMSIKLVNKNGKEHEFHVILIALIKNNKIAKLWEITYPTWSDKLTTSGKED